MRVRPRSAGSTVYLCGLLLIALFLAVVAWGHWRSGVAGIGAVFTVVAIVRAFVPQAHKGMLGVRNRAFDVFWTMTLGIALLLLAVTVPSYR